MTRAVAHERQCHLYGTRDGEWCLVEIPRGQGWPNVTRPWVDLQAPEILISWIYYRWVDMLPLMPVGELLARHLDCSQQSISRFIHGGHPRLSNAGWSALVRLAFAPLAPLYAMLPRRHALAAPTPRTYLPSDHTDLVVLSGSDRERLGGDDPWMP